MAKKDIGTQFQDDVQATLKRLQTTGLLRFVRLYDTKSARNAFLPQQPGDFIVAGKHGGHLVECKASEKYESLADCYKTHVKPHQGAELRLWRKTNNPSWVLFYSQPTSKIQVWIGEDVGLALAGEHKLTKPLLEVSVSILLELLQLLFIGPINDGDLNGNNNHDFH